MRAKLEDLDDIIAAYAARSGATLPHELVLRELAGEHPVRLWREHLGMNAAALATAAKVSKAYLSEIETGRKPGSAEGVQGDRRRAGRARRCRAALNEGAFFARTADW